MVAIAGRKAPARKAQKSDRTGGLSFTGSMGFKAAPEFAAAERKVRVDLIGPGKALVSIDVETPAGDDPVIGAWLSFLARDMRDNPQRMASLSEAEATALQELVKGVTVRDDDIIPDDVTI
jgi:hypothetical protein